MLLKRYFWAINLTLITLFVWASVHLFLTIVSTKLDQRPLPRPRALSAQRQKADEKPKQYFALLAAHNVFDPYGEGHLKRPEASQKERESAPPPAPPLSTVLRLKGTVAGGKEFGLAIVDDLEQRRQEVVKLGQRIKNAVLVAVTRQEAVFDVGGRQETLPLLEKDTPARAADRPTPVLGGAGRRARSTSPSRSRATVSRPGASSRRGRASGTASVVKALSPSRFAVDRRGLNRLAAEPQKLAGEARIIAQGDGLVINDVPPGGLAAQAGLRSGDIVKRINGEPVTSPLQALQAYQRGLSLPVMKVEVTGPNGNRTLTYELR